MLESSEAPMSASDTNHSPRITPRLVMMSPSRYWNRSSKYCTLSENSGLTVAALTVSGSKSTESTGPIRA